MFSVIITFSPCLQFFSSCHLLPPTQQAVLGCLGPDVASSGPASWKPWSTVRSRGCSSSRPGALPHRRPLPLPDPQKVPPEIESRGLQTTTPRSPVALEAGMTDGAGAHGRQRAQGSATPTRRVKDSFRGTEDATPGLCRRGERAGEGKLVAGRLRNNFSVYNTVTKKKGENGKGCGKEKGNGPKLAGIMQLSGKTQ